MVLSAGCRAVDVKDVVQEALVPVRFLYPTQAPGRAEPFGPFTLDLAVDAPVEGHELPLVVISHGTGGTPWTHRDLAAHLARAGFVAALIQDPGNNGRKVDST
jgi:predicted dienelactone hydrolase